MGRSHENPHVAEALDHLRAAQQALNMAGHPYDIGIRGVDEPYGMVERAMLRTFEHAFPDIDPDMLMHVLIDSGEDVAYCVDHLRQEAAYRAKLLDPYREFERTFPGEDPGARVYALPNGWALWVQPQEWRKGGDAMHRAARDERWEVTFGVWDGRVFDTVPNPPCGTGHPDTVNGNDRLADWLEMASEVPQR